MLKKFTFLIKIAITSLVMFLILRSVPFESYKDAYRLLSTKTLSLLISSVFLQVFFLAYRWKILIHIASQREVTLIDTIKGTLTSFFVSQGLLASVGADAFKVWWMTKRNIATQSGVKITLMDRIYGLVSLMMICVLSLVLFYLFIGTAHTQLLSLTIAIVVVGSVLGLFFIPLKFQIKTNSEKKSTFIRSLLIKLLSFGKDIRDTLSQQKVTSFLTLFILSVMAHGIVIVQAYIVGQALNPAQITFLVCALAIPPAIFVSYMPFSIAGWGLREASMAMAFGLIKISASTAIIISITIGMAVFITSLLGGVFWLLDLRKKQTN